jgi:hypothetical protein
VTPRKLSVTLRAMTAPEMPTELPVSPSPPTRRRTGLIIGIGAAIIVAAAGGAAAAVALTGHSQQPVAAAATPSATPVADVTTEAPAPTAAPVPTPARLDPRSMCIALIPTLQAGAHIVLAMANTPDGSTIDRAKLSSTIGELESLSQEAPNSMVLDIQSQEATLQSVQSVLTTGFNRTLDFSSFKETGTRLATGCLPYVTD